jgi:putative ATPase
MAMSEPDLFTDPPKLDEAALRPLADRMRPRNLDEGEGQAALLGRERPLRRALDAGKAHSMILWGPPGTGKTTLGRLVAQQCDAQFLTLSAVLSGVRDIRSAVERAQMHRRAHGGDTVLFVDEVHRFNKAQQDEGAIRRIIDRAVADPERGLGASGLRVEDDARALMAAAADGDARQGLHILELDPNATLYWLARMLDGGTDPLYLGRRLIRIASEDIGNADPRALHIGLDACQVYERLGSPEGELAIAQAAAYMACAPKSNAVYRAFAAAMEDAKRYGSLPVPPHLRNAPTALMEKLGHGRGYRYPHDEPEAYAAGERYFPDDMQAKRYYSPPSRGLEQKIADKLAHLAALDRQRVDEDEPDEQ